ncbi:MAG TPA: radical SAM protein [Clostridia bacterium]|nr:radical SAM protein [Clostridia bacterium]
MKIVLGYPPLDCQKGIPQISQNRQFQWTKGGPVAYFIYPVVPACAASLLKEKDYQVFWLDGLAEKMNYEQWEKKLLEINPDILAIETKTPVIKYHWQIINKLKKDSPRLKIVLMGDHVTALPQESMENSLADFVITGGDYDFGLLSIANYLAKGEKLEPGIWYREERGNEIRNSGKFTLSHHLGELPIIDRDLTKWRLYAFKNSNFYQAPGAYTMFGRDCWWGKCTFCSWTTLFPGEKYRVMSVKQAIEEVENLVENYGVKEIMDDSGTFPIGDWLREFCREVMRRGYQKKVRFDCNLRFNAGMTKEDYLLMGQAGFRFVLYGLESASQETLERINKNLRVEQIEPVLKWAKEAGLKPHLTVMVGYPWESEKDVNNTIAFAEKLFRDGLADSLQATVVIPYPGTPLFDDCLKNKLLKTKDWNRYDMQEAIMKTKVPEGKLLGAVRSLYSRSIWTPRFIFNTLSQLKSIAGIKYVGFQGFKYLAKLLEFS